MSSPIGSPTSTSPINDIDLGPAGNSVQLMFAKLQLSQSSLCKDEATKRMKEIQGTQAEQKELAKHLADLRGKIEKCTDATHTEKLSDELIAYCKEHKIDIGTGVLNKEKLTNLQKTLTDKQEMMGSGTQTIMVYLQDFIGQYNSFLQGANSAIATANQVLSSIAKGQ